MGYPVRLVQGFMGFEVQGFLGFRFVCLRALGLNEFRVVESKGSEDQGFWVSTPAGLIGLMYGNMEFRIQVRSI